MGIVYVTHAKWEVARIADHVIRVKHGKVAECLSPAQFRAEHQPGFQIGQTRFCENCTKVTIAQI